MVQLSPHNRHVVLRTLGRKRLAVSFSAAITCGVDTGIAVRENIVIYARGLSLLNILRACAVVLMLGMLGALLGCAAPSASHVADAPSRDVFDAVRNADLSARFPTTEAQSQGSGQSPTALLFPGADVDPESRRDHEPGMRNASFQQAAFVKGDGLQQAGSVKGDGLQQSGSVMGDGVELRWERAIFATGCAATISSYTPTPSRQTISTSMCWRN